MPVMACTDANTDLGQVISDGEFGWWCESNNSDSFKDIIDLICSQRDGLSAIGYNARKYLVKNYTVKTSYEIIMNNSTNHFGGIDNVQ